LGRRRERNGLYGQVIKLSEEEGKPLLKAGKVEKT
jgi:hypothetical protein